MGNATAPIVVGNSVPVEIGTNYDRTFGYALRRRNEGFTFPVTWRVKPIKTTEVFEFAIVDQHPKDLQPKDVPSLLIGTRDVLSCWIVGMFTYSIIRLFCCAHIRLVMADARMSQFYSDILSTSWHCVLGTCEGFAVIGVDSFKTTLDYAIFYLPNDHKKSVDIITRVLWIVWKFSKDPDESLSHVYGMINDASDGNPEPVQVAKIQHESPKTAKLYIRGTELALQRTQTRISNDTDVVKTAAKETNRPHPGGVGCDSSKHCSTCGRFAGADDDD
jgi:hypothetical protein